MTSQVVGLAEAVGLPFTRKHVVLRAPWRWLPGPICLGVLHGLDRQSDPLTPPWPRLLISCGRRSALVARAIRRASGGATFCVHVQDPQISPTHFDLVVPPRHDGLSGANVLPTRGALHRVTADKLAAARERFAALFATLPRPWVAVLLGGSNRTCRFDPERATTFGHQLAESARTHGAGLIITPSRRTEAASLEALRATLTGVPHHLWDGTGENPYFGLLALADHLVVTGDSVSMVSEACSTGKPVHILHLPGYSRRLQRFHDELQEEGATRPFDGQLVSMDYEPVDDTPRIAAEIRRRLALPAA